METTIIIAQVLGIYFIVSGLFVIFRQKTLVAVLKDLFEHRSIAFLAGVMMVFAGGALVLRGNIGTDSLSIFVKIVSWLVLIKGIVYMLAPEWPNLMVKHLPRPILWILGPAITILGIYLTFYI